MRKLPGMLRLENLSKRYGDHLVFQGLTHTFAPGCYALCEEDSTGKTTLLRMIAGEIPPDDGEVWVDGHSMVAAPGRAKGRIAYVPQNCLLWPEQTGRELLEQVARQKNAQLDQHVLELVQGLGLETQLDKRFEQMSTGTRRKVYLAAAGLGDPAVIIADGPSDGLDARTRTFLGEQFKTWSRDRVVLFASHDAELVAACGAHRFSITARASATHVK